MIVSITTKQSHYDVYTIIILLFRRPNVVGSMTRPGARGLGPGLGLKYEIVLRAGPSLDIIVAARAEPGPHNSICGPARARSAQLLRARAGPGPQIMFAGLAWA